jgi:hypothetical protein
LRGDKKAGAGLVLGDDGLAEALRELFGVQPRDRRATETCTSNKMYQ